MDQESKAHCQRLFQAMSKGGNVFCEAVWPLNLLILIELLSPCSSDLEPHLCSRNASLDYCSCWYSLVWEGGPLCKALFPLLNTLYSALLCRVWISHSAPADVIMCPALWWSQEHSSSSVQETDNTPVTCTRYSRFQVVHHSQISSKDFKIVPCGVLDPVGSRAS